jgi:TolA-binding protein
MRSTAVAVVVAAFFGVVLTGCGGASDEELQQLDQRIAALDKRVADLQAQLEDEQAKATAVEKRLTARLRAVRRQISGLETTSEAVSSIQECGNKPAGGAWTYEPILGAGHTNLTAANLSCSEARSVVDQLDFSSDPPSYPGWTCEFVSHKYEFAEIRCTSGIKALRFQTGS